MKRVTIIRVLAVLAVLAALAVMPITSKHVVPAVYATQPSVGCTNATLSGHYAIMQPAGLTTQSSSGSGSTTVPWQFAGAGFFDGNGTFTTNYTPVVNGTPFPPQNPTGSYHVFLDSSNNCVGTLSLPAPVSYDANIYIVGGGAEVFGISTDQGNTATFDMKKQ